VLVLGHTSCGAVTAAVNAMTAPGQISILYKRLQPAVKEAGGDINRAVRTNAELQANLLMTSSPVIRDAVKAGALRVEAGVYDLATGKVRLSVKP
jgi:carbonic anhydrase